MDTIDLILIPFIMVYVFFVCLILHPYKFKRHWMKIVVYSYVWGIMAISIYGMIRRLM